MPLSQIQIGDDEDIVRIFLRFPSQQGSFRTLLPNDFTRKMDLQSGISLLRVGTGFLTRDQAMAWIKGSKPRGLASCKGKVLKSLGLKFVASSASDPHLSTRCAGCDLNPAQGQAPLCTRTDGQACDFKMAAANSLPIILSYIFTIHTPIE